MADPGTRRRRGGAWRIAAAVALLCLAGSLPAAAQLRPQVTEAGPPPPRNVIWIGNSFFRFNNGMHEHFAAFVRGAPAPAPALGRQRAIARSGIGLRDHDVRSYLQAEPTPTGGAEAPGGGGSARPFDIAILQDCSYCTWGRDRRDQFAPLVRSHSETVRSFGAEPVLFMTWAYADRQDQMRGVAEAYTAAGNANRALVIPAGLAFRRAMAERPDIALHMPDKRHPTVAGSYLAAATSFAAIFARTPEGNRHEAGLDPAVAAFLQRVAWRTVGDYYAGRIVAE